MFTSDLTNMFTSALANMFTSDLTNMFTSALANMFTSALPSMFTSDLANMFTSASANMFTSDLANMFTSPSVNMFTSDLANMCTSEFEKCKKMFWPSCFLVKLTGEYVGLVPGIRLLIRRSKNFINHVTHTWVLLTSAFFTGNMKLMLFQEIQVWIAF